MGPDFKKLMAMRVKIYPLEHGKMDILRHFYSIKVLPNSNLSSRRIYFLAMTLPDCQKSGAMHRNILKKGDESLFFHSIVTLATF